MNTSARETSFKEESCAGKRKDTNVVFELWKTCHLFSKLWNKMEVILSQLFACAPTEIHQAAPLVELWKAQTLNSKIPHYLRLWLCFTFKILWFWSFFKGIPVYLRTCFFYQLPVPAPHPHSNTHTNPNVFTNTRICIRIIDTCFNILSLLNA